MQEAVIQESIPNESVTKNATQKTTTQNSLSKHNLFTRDFSLVIIGQIISLFGNQILSFVLPLYLFDITGSATLLGVISACSFIPMIILCPVGGIIADRINKRNIMVALDFTTAFITAALSILLGKVNIIVLLLIVLIVLYGIQGAYQPAVQASIPALVAPQEIVKGNAVINLVNSLSGLIGPSVGAILYSVFGIMPILYISIICFSISATMEIFIKIPHKRQETDGSILKIATSDLKESFNFIRVKQPAIWKVSLVIAAINLFLSSLIIIGFPVIIKQILPFDEVTANRLYGFAQSAIAFGSLAGGLLAGILGKKLKPCYSSQLLLICTFTLIPMGLALNLTVNPYISYAIILISCVIMMCTATLFSIQMMSILQLLTPTHLIGKVISCAMCIGMCANPVGHALYGVLFDIMASCPYMPFYIATAITVLVCILSRNVFKKLDSQLMKM